MMKLKVNGKEYKFKYGYNCFCDTDLMDRVREMATMFSGDDPEDPTGMKMVKELFDIVRELLYTGSQKYNPFESLQEVGDFLDEYMDEETDEQRGLLHLFQQLSEELFSEGFLADVTGNQNGMDNGAKAPTDHKKK